MTGVLRDARMPKGGHMRHETAAAAARMPDAVRLYLAHVADGTSIRAIARARGVHASTVLRSVRRTEARRDDPLVDEALGALAAASAEAGAPILIATESRMPHAATARAVQTDAADDAPCREELRVLRRLCETGAVLAVAPGMENAVVVREVPGGEPARTAVTTREVARAMALKEWIEAPDAAPGPAGRPRIARYRVTAPGRAALKRMLAEDALRGGMEEEGAIFAAQHREEGTRPDPDAPDRRLRCNLAESPLAALARRRDADGAPFLADALVSAGERLREDFELAQMGPRTAQNWENFLTGGGGRPCAPSDPIRGPEGARARVAAALADLGPGLGDVALRTCCYLEGLETAEKRMGWSARSGKIVLRIALQRLALHYEGLGEAGKMIG